MTQLTDNPRLLQQIVAGLGGRRQGHSYETMLSDKINSMPMPWMWACSQPGHIQTGKPEEILLNKLLNYLGWDSCSSILAYDTGRLATAEDGDRGVTIDGHPIKECKSDIVVKMRNGQGLDRTIGISIKQCNNKAPTNAQVFFTTATAFHRLLNDNGLHLSVHALKSMRQFCGDNGFRPCDDFDCSARVSSPERYFWEETDVVGRTEWEDLFGHHQDEVTRLLLQKGYSEDPFPPEIIFHKTKRAEEGHEEIAIYSMDEFIALSHEFGGFSCQAYRVKKGRYKEPAGVEHQAPRFGVVQMQRGGQKQHPSQLQFNLKAGYFYLPPFM